MKRITNVEKEVRQHLGQVIQRARDERGVSQEELSKETGITRTFLSLVENGKRFPSYDTLVRISSLLGRDLTGLLIEAKLDQHDEDFRLASLLMELIESKDEEKLARLARFAKSLVQSRVRERNMQLGIPQPWEEKMSDNFPLSNKRA
jgi:transcriptional regulator with XRE-family HTH domain